jgi:uncharacterized protein
VICLFIAAIRLELSIPHANSLKAKRQAISRVIEKARSRFNVSVAEVGDQDLWQRSVVALAVVSGEVQHARESADKVIAFIESHFEGEVCRIDVEIL